MLDVGNSFASCTVLKEMADKKRDCHIDKFYLKLISFV